MTWDGRDELLNFPPHHPAREMQDSFYADGRGRHPCAPYQRRADSGHARVLPGADSRRAAGHVLSPNEQVTARSEMQFTQLELLAVGENITFADPKGTLTSSPPHVRRRAAQTRFRANFLHRGRAPRWTSVVSCAAARAATLQVHRLAGILVAGMVHRPYCATAAMTRLKYFASPAGLGPERIAMLKYGIDDIRQFWANV